MCRWWRSICWGPDHPPSVFISRVVAGGDGSWGGGVEGDGGVSSRPAASRGLEGTRGFEGTRGYDEGKMKGGRRSWRGMKMSDEACTVSV
ncbi:hypothetical protein Pmani_018807 [Petrolisthes manimaculis]|uniref:Uncharacterized protein n=1 Tax=Petrolisthes manimaculis TaxID=1843537 RepID=A0AAE1PLS0_9EUCA|nr:hypothetical protein Pmani_018807 [Petrolisthes manimaculis]